MSIRTYLFAGIILSLILTGTGVLFGEEEAPVEPQAQEVPVESEVQWIWGDVVSVDAVARKILVKYLDYETDTEKEISISMDDKTVYENVKSMGEIKPSDTVSVDYIINPDGGNIAKNITVEKTEGAQPLPQEGQAVEPKTLPSAE